MESRRTVLTVIAVAALLVLATHLADRWAYETIVLERVYEEDWGRMLRVMGFLPFWMAGALALVLTDWPARTRESVAPALRRGLLLFGAAALSGAAGELLKLVFRRERPRAHAGEYVFRAFIERPFHSGGLALPSSHAVIAFGAAAMLARLFPRAAPVWYALAIGCALTRVAAGAHFLSDVAVSAIVGWVIAALLWRRFGRSTARTQERSPAG
ncbi:MAG: phosphatase PAP2 family protein [Longimicrobiales bacterium]